MNKASLLSQNFKRGNLPLMLLKRSLRVLFVSTTSFLFIQPTLSDSASNGSLLLSSSLGCSSASCILSLSAALFQLQLSLWPTLKKNSELILRVNGKNYKILWSYKINQQFKGKIQGHRKQFLLFYNYFRLLSNNL